jgi:hypothetical protein
MVFRFSSSPVLPVLIHFSTINRGVSSTYRHTNKEVPTKASYFIASVAAPLRTLLNENAAFLSSQSRARIVERVCVPVSERYWHMLTDLLQSVEKGEALLRKMVKKTERSDGSGASVSDIDKIHIQMHLDVCEWGVQMQEFGVNLASFELYARLMEATETGQRLFNEIRAGRM